MKDARHFRFEEEAAADLMLTFNESDTCELSLAKALARELKKRQGYDRAYPLIVGVARLVKTGTGALEANSPFLDMRDEKLKGIGLARKCFPVARACVKLGILSDGEITADMVAGVWRELGSKRTGDARRPCDKTIRSHIEAFRKAAAAQDMSAVPIG